jgi:hypothetical protein
MVSKNNQKLLARKNARQHQHFALRKLTIGLASVLLGTTIYGAADADQVATANQSADANVSLTESSTQPNSAT